MAIDIGFYESLLNLRPAKMRQASSFGRDPDRGGTWCGFRPREALKKRILLAPGEKHILARIPGPGMITRIFMTTLLPFNRHALRGLVLRFYWDGEAHPSVEAPFGDFFGAPFGQPVGYISQIMSLTSRAFNCLWPMPFGEGALLEVHNESERQVEPFFYNITYDRWEEPPSPLRFHAQWRRENPTQPRIPYTILSAKGRGHYIGCHLFMQNLEWWLRPPLRRIPFPYGFGMGMLEGWESIYVDGEATPSAHGTGTEDYLNGAWYYVFEKAFAGPYHGCTLRDYLQGRISAYRLDLLAPVPFERSLIVHLDHGFENKIRADYASVAYWYQEEPHQPFPPLLHVARRQPASPLPNLLQGGMLGGVLAGLPLAVGLAFWKKWKRRL